MTSFVAYIISWVVWFKFKRRWSNAVAFRKSIASERKVEDYRPPPKLKKKVKIEESQVWGFPVYHVSPKSDKAVQSRILYCHGGGFVFEISAFHWTLVAKLAERAHATVTVVIYPLGPETPLLDMFDAVQPLYNQMAAAEEPTPFCVMGDSAGGAMCFVLTQQALKAGLPAASRMVPITPLLDASLTNPEAHAVAERDPWLGIEGVQEATRLIAPDVDVHDPRVSPLYGDFSDLPPMLILMASEDLLMPDAKKAVDKAKAQDRQVDVWYGEGMVHIWPVLPIPEADAAVDHIAKWLRERRRREALAPREFVLH